VSWKPGERISDEEFEEINDFYYEIEVKPDGRVAKWFVAPMSINSEPSEGFIRFEQAARLSPEDIETDRALLERIGRAARAGREAALREFSRPAPGAQAHTAEA
jgi:hypothetical protein